jgi:hypothetical protein
MSSASKVVSAARPFTVSRQYFSPRTIKPWLASFERHLAVVSMRSAVSLASLRAAGRDSHPSRGHLPTMSERQPEFVCLLA